MARWQISEKPIPHTALHALRGKSIKIYTESRNVGDRRYASDHARAPLRVFEKGTGKDWYNIGTYEKRANLSLVLRVFSMLDKLAPHSDICSREWLIKFFSDREMHEHRYAINATKMRSELA